MVPMTVLEIANKTFLHALIHQENEIFTHTRREYLCGHYKPGKRDDLQMYSV